MRNNIESIGAVVLAVGVLLIIGYLAIAIGIFIVGMLAGLLARPALWLTSKTMSLFGIQWKFTPYRRVLVLDEDGAYESREVWEGFPDDWLAFSDEWLLGTISAAVMWPVYVFAFVSWPIRRITAS